MQAQAAHKHHSHSHESPPAHVHDHNCSSCHHHDHEAKRTNTASLLNKIHEHNGHQCTSHECPIEAPHGHNLEADHNHKHEHNHDHKHEHNHSHATAFWPLEDFIAHAPIPKWLREITLNTSFLSPALIVSTLLEHAKLPKLIKTWLAITAMHGVNRGTEKLSRLGLTYIVSAAATLGSSSKLGSTLSRFIATTCIALVEKFSGNAHQHHEASHNKSTPGNNLEKISKELEILIKNMGNKKQWLELLPSLLNIETKVQIVAPLVNKLITAVSSKVQSSYQPAFNLLSKILLTSISFVGTDKLLLNIIKLCGGEASNFAASFSTICGCCASPVCSAAATDTALNNSL